MECMPEARVTRRDDARFHCRGPRRAGRFLPPYWRSGWPGRYGGLGVKTVTRGMPVTVFLVAAVCGNFGRAF
jgi:hypothetical protein